MDHAHTSSSNNNNNNSNNSNHSAPTKSAADQPPQNADLVEGHILASYSNNNKSDSTRTFPPPHKQVEWVYNPSDGSVLLDHRGIPVSVDKILATKPLKGELHTRPGPGGRKLTYMSGDGISRTLNDIFGYDGWNLDITKVQREECVKPDGQHGKYSVVYTAMVRVTHKASGAYKEDCGAGDSTDKCFATAVSHALKASITDAMKRAARHFGDKLGNCEYPLLYGVRTRRTHQPHHRSFGVASRSHRVAALFLFLLILILYLSLVSGKFQYQNGACDLEGCLGQVRYRTSQHQVWICQRSSQEIC
jgi:DNA recombination protein Rad52